MINLNFTPSSLADAEQKVERRFQSKLDACTGTNLVTQAGKAVIGFLAPVSRFLAPDATKDAENDAQESHATTTLNNKILTSVYHTPFLQQTIARSIFEQTHPDTIDRLSSACIQRLENMGLTLIQVALAIVQLLPVIFYSTCSLLTLCQNEDFKHHATVEITQLGSHAMLIGIHAIGIFSIDCHHDAAMDYGRFLIGLDNTKPLLDQISQAI